VGSFAGFGRNPADFNEAGLSGEDFPGMGKDLNAGVGGGATGNLEGPQTLVFHGERVPYFAPCRYDTEIMHDGIDDSGCRRPGVFSSEEQDQAESSDAQGNVGLHRGAPTHGRH
jgi:hypothetical protein